jgi:hypothetical protein
MNALKILQPVRRVMAEISERVTGALGQKVHDFGFYTNPQIADGAKWDRLRLEHGETARAFDEIHALCPQLRRVIGVDNDHVGSIVRFGLAIPPGEDVRINHHQVKSLDHFGILGLFPPNLLSADLRDDPKTKKLWWCAAGDTLGDVTGRIGPKLYEKACNLKLVDQVPNGTYRAINPVIEGQIIDDEGARTSALITGAKTIPLIHG